jgi:hypothetical protein
MMYRRLRQRRHEEEAATVLLRAALIAVAMAVGAGFAFSALIRLIAG